MSNISNDTCLSPIAVCIDTVKDGHFEIHPPIGTHSWRSCRTQIVRLYLKTTEARYISTEVAQESFNISLLNQRTSSLYRLGAGGSPPGPLELGLEFDPSDGAGAGLIGRLMMF